MVKQISISDNLAEFLDHFRNEWGEPGVLSYTKTIERFVKTTDAEEILRREVAEAFKNLQFRLPKRFFYNLEILKGAVLSMISWEEEERENFCDKLHLAMVEVKNNSKNKHKGVEQTIET